MNIALSDLILNICGDMSPVLDNFQLERLKNVMMIECLLSTGCRVSELVQLKRTDIQDGKAKILGKGRRERMWCKC